MIQSVFPSTHPILCCKLSPLLHLLRHQLPHSVYVGRGAELVLEVLPGLEQHEPLLLLLTCA